jgi:N-acetyl-alpha-D-muramate 1-phosphate uridylyltransferase
MGEAMIHVTHAMVLAAGFGTRMRPLTNTTPKPLIEVAGKSLLDYGFEHLREAQIETAVVNGHYLADQIEAWCETQSTPHTIFSSERDAILDTGGGIARALPLLGKKPFYVLNADCFWLDGKIPALERLRTTWNDATMDCLLLLCDPAQTTGYDGQGDFVLDDLGRVLRRADKSDSQALAYIGGYLVHPRFFKNPPEGAFSTNVLWNRAMAQGRLFGLAHDGHWLHVGTVEAIKDAEDFLRQA